MRTSFLYGYQFVFKLALYGFLSIISVGVCFTRSKLKRKSENQTRFSCHWDNFFIYLNFVRFTTIKPLCDMTLDDYLWYLVLQGKHKKGKKQKLSRI